jgi:enoyl-CoA hydratase/carnithine racemase
MSTDDITMVNGPFKLGLTEVSIGLCFPAYFGAVVSYAMTKGNFRQHVQRGATLTPAEASACGMIDALVESPEHLIPCVMQRATAIKRWSLPAYRETKHFLQLPVITELNQPGYAEELDNRFRDVWRSEGTQGYLRASVERLQKKNKE